MFSLDWKTALHNAGSIGARMPEKTDARHTALGVFPALTPRFTFRPGDQVFTIGSCFARNIEEKLPAFKLPTRDFGVSKEEWPYQRPNGIINEYNPGSMRQRILWAMSGASPGEAGVAETGDDKVLDLLLPGPTGVSRTRFEERRRQIDAVYAHLPRSDVVVITLGLVEAWYDRVDALYLNQMPPFPVLRVTPDRYELRRLDVDDAYPLLEESLGALVSGGVSKILLTVSPVPLNTTFTGQDCFVANMFSKAVLRVCADRLARTFSEVDYFPSYEIVASGGLANFIEDNTHVRDEVVGAVVEHMLSAYVQPAAA